MTINLSKAVKGSVVTFRCGGSAVIDYWHGDHFFFVGEDFNQDSEIWYNDGHVHEEGNHPLDIISITPPAFDWKDLESVRDFLSGVLGYWTTSNECLPHEQETRQALAKIDAILAATKGTRG